LIGFGIVLVPVGMLIERRRRRKHGTTVPSIPRIDLNIPRHRELLIFFGSLTLVFLFLTAVGSYRAYEYTDSVNFCGQLCHSVMHPEFIAYQGSPHARVACVECHVGPGATWYMRAKLTGLYQVYATTFNKYPKPIPTPVHSLRPAQDTCEQCHWPEKFMGAQLRVFTHFAPDEKNTPRQVRMLIKTGGGSPLAGQVAGIHWHMNIANDVTYAATDDKRQVIPWVRIRDHQGRVTEYFAKDSGLTKDQIAKLPVRKMDCVDCHNRPSHIYRPPDHSVDESLLARRLDPTLPYVKKVSAEALTGDYKSTAEAMEGIATRIDRYYLTEHRQLHSARQRDIKQTIEEVQRIYRTTIFPEMKVDWRTHPNNIGHMLWPGCFRCHDGKHVSPEGLMVRNECEICHTVLSQEESGATMAIKGTQFQHPIDVGDLKEAVCSDCHGGSAGGQ
jgi:nitrate/TMAO reductase-like tetraheme cytochrome c subunit